MEMRVGALETSVETMKKNVEAILNTQNMILAAQDFMLRSLGIDPHNLCSPNVTSSTTNATQGPANALDVGYAPAAEPGTTQKNHDLEVWCRSLSPNLINDLD
ncbi:unnamed protein product [Cochlearia groenlandica]